MSIILASASPRRKELMKLVGFEYKVVPSDVEEVVPCGMAIEDIPQYLSSLKANDVAARYPDDIVIGSDTLVEFDGKTLGKPVDEADAARMLRELSGRHHKVYTGVTIVYPAGERGGDERRGDEACGEQGSEGCSKRGGDKACCEKSRKTESFTSIADVEFLELTDDVIDWYISTGETLDKAGAYGIQGPGAVLIKGICGDYFTVMGLPIAEVWHRIKNHERN